MGQRQLKALWKRLEQLRQMKLPEIHRIAETKAGLLPDAARSNAMVFPAVAPKKILLVIIEVRRHEARFVLAGGCFERAQIGAIGLTALVERDVSQGGRTLFDTFSVAYRRSQHGSLSLSRAFC